MEDKQLQELIHEILVTERSYNDSLGKLVENFLSKLPVSEDLEEKRDRHLVVSNTPAVLAVAQRFLAELELAWKNKYNTDLLEVTCGIIDTYVEKDFDVYVRYCGNMDHQRRKYHELLKENTKFQDAVRRCLEIEEMQKLPLDSYFLLPMQRITRLPLLMEKICEKTSCHYHQGQRSQRTLRNLQKIVRRCNELARQMINMELIASIDRQLDFASLKKVPIVNRERSLVKKGELTELVKPQRRLHVNLRGTEKKIPVFIFLFSDLILVTKVIKEKETEKYEVLDYAYRNFVEARSLQASQLSKWFPPSFLKTSPHVMLVALVENSLKKSVEYFFSCETLSERERWIDALTSAKQVSPDERLYEDWDLPQVQAKENYTAQQEDELGLEEGDVVNVYKKMSDGWYEGERIRDGERGWFPAVVTMEVQNAHVRARNKRQRYRLLVCSYMEWKQGDNRDATLGPDDLDTPIPLSS